jgi:HD-like signal output (HDOD) protein
MVSVLFVDDTEVGLRALRDTFAIGSQSWDTAFVPGADVALYMMGERPVDAVVASARLSGMSTADFLRLTKLRYPRVARIALSNPGDRGAMLSTLPVANQCLSKSCGIEVLARAVELTTQLQGKLFSEATQRLVAAVGALPSLPASLTAVDAALSNENSSLGQIADIMSGDVAMVAKVLQLVNSSFFGLRAEIGDLRQAVAYLGVETLRDFALASAVFRAFTPSPLLPGDWLARFNAHSLAVADIMAQLVRTSAAKCEANVSGTLHDIGELIVAERAPEKLLEIASDVRAGASPDEAEVRHVGTTYPVIGGYLLSMWGLGHNVIEAVARQREIWAGPPREPALADVIRVADHMAGSELAAAVDEKLPAVGSTLAGDAVAVPVCQSSTAIGIDENYQEHVGLLGVVRLYNQGFLKLN